MILKEKETNNQIRKTIFIFAITYRFVIISLFKEKSHSILLISLIQQHFHWHYCIVFFIILFAFVPFFI